MLEDNPADAGLIERVLTRAGLQFDSELCDTKETYLYALEQFRPDFVLSDNNLPTFTGIEALEAGRAVVPRIPFILVTGTVSEEFAVTVIKRGADDYILKDRLERLPSAIEAVLRQRSAEYAGVAATARLVESETRYRTLVERAFDAILLYTPDGAIVDCNPSACIYTGYTAMELKTMYANQLLFKEDVQYLPDFTTLRAGKTSLDYHRIRRKNGDAIEMEIVTKVLPDGNYMAVGRDMTERNKAMAQQALFSSIVSSSDDAIISKDINGCITSWNRAAEILFGYTSSEAIGQHIGFIIPEELTGEEVVIMQRIKQGKHVDHYETWRRRKDGDRIAVSLSISPVRDSKGNIIGASKIARDITQRKEAERRIMESEHHLKTIIENTMEGFILLNAAGVIKAFNNRARNITLAFAGYELQTGIPVLHLIEPDRRALVEEIFGRVLQGETLDYERSYTTATGDVMWIEFSYLPVWRNHHVEGICITSRDITDHKRAEAALERNYLEKRMLASRLSAILHTLPASIALLDKTGVIIDVNDAWKRFADENGFTGVNYGIRSNYLQVSSRAVGPDQASAEKAINGVRSVLQKLVPEFVFEYACHSPAQQRWFRMVVSPLEEKEYTGAVVMHIDISELRRLEQERLDGKIEEQRRITEAMLEGQEKERNAIGIELHDNVNQILVGTTLLLSIVKSNPVKNAGLLEECMENIKRAVNENRKLAHELVTPNEESETLLQQIERLCDDMLRPANIQTGVECDNCEDALIHPQIKLTLYRIVQEHCTNIIKHAQAKHVHFLLATGANMLTLRIADDGVGADNATLNKGIGLKNMVSRLDVVKGTLEVDTGLGTGFVLLIKIPLV